MSSKQKYFIGMLTILWFATLFLMLQNYQQYPPLDSSDPLNDRLNNIEGSLLKYGLISFAELLFGILIMIYFFSISKSLRFLLIISSIGLVGWSYIDAMYSGGVVSTHALWFTLEMGMVYGFTMLMYFKKHKVNH